MEDIIDPGRLAVVIIDMQRDTVPRFSSGLEHVAPLRQMIARAHELGAPVFFVKATRHPDYSDEGRAVTDSMLQGGKSHREQGILAPGTVGVEVWPDLDPRPNDFYIAKRRGNAFFGTDLDLLLRHYGRDTIAIGGISTHQGVESTVRDGRDRDFNMVVLADGCSSNPPVFHEYAIANILPRYARVRTVDQVLAMIGQFVDGQRGQ